MWYRICVFGLISLKWSLFSINVVSRPVCVGEMVILVLYATAILNCPTLVLKSPIICSLNPSPWRPLETKRKKKSLDKLKVNLAIAGALSLTSDVLACAHASAICTYLNYQLVDFLNRFDRRCQNIPCSSCATIYMQALSVLLAPTTWAMCPYDYK